MFVATHRLAAHHADHNGGNYDPECRKNDWGKDGRGRRQEGGKYHRGDAEHGGRLMDPYIHRLPL